MNNKILALFTNRTIVFLQGKNFVHRMIMKAQSLYTKEVFGMKSLWGHVGVIINGYFYESTIMTKRDGVRKFLWWKIKKWKVVQGCIKTPIEEFTKKLTKKKYKLLGFQKDFQLTNDQWDLILDKAEQMINDRVEYAKKEIVGTLIRLIRWKFASKKKREKLMEEANRFDSSNVYCIAYVADCMEASGKEYIDVNHSVSVVDEGWHDCEMPCNNRLVKVKNL